MRKDLMEILACPNCDERPPLRLQDSYLICDRCNSAYPILDGIPHLLPEDARPLSETDTRADGGK